MKQTLQNLECIFLEIMFWWEYLSASWCLIVYDLLRHVQYTFVCVCVPESCGRGSSAGCCGWGRLGGAAEPPPCTRVAPIPRQHHLPLVQSILHLLHLHPHCCRRHTPPPGCLHHCHHRHGSPPFIQTHPHYWTQWGGRLTQCCTPSNSEVWESWQGNSGWGVLYIPLSL